MSLPVLRRALGVQDQGVGFGTLENRVLAAGQVIDRRSVREREAVRAVLVILVLLAGGIDGPGEAMVHPHQSSARDVRHHAVEYTPILRVGVVSPVDEFPDAAPGLRASPRIRLVNGPGEGVRDAATVRVVVPQKAHEVAHHRVTDPVGPRIAGGVDHLVDPPGLEAVEDVDVRVRLDERGFGPLRVEPDTALGAGERPAIVRDRLARVTGIAPPRQTCRRRVEGNGGVASR